MLDSETMWIFLTFLAIVFTGIRGYQRKRMATELSNHQHLHLIATITTTVVCMVVIGYTQPDIPVNYAYFFVLCLINGLGYALAGVCNFGAVQHLKLATFQSLSKLSVFLPVVIFYFILDEKISSSQLIGILSVAFPIMMLAYIEPGMHASGKVKRDTRKGVYFLILFILIASAMQIVNVLAVKDGVKFALGVDPFLFIMSTNALSLPYLMFLIIKARERVSLSVKHFTAGIFLGLVNSVAVVCFLLAVRSGPASIILPLYSMNAFVSIALLMAFPMSQGKSLTRKTVLIFTFLALWSMSSVWILISSSIS